MAPVVATYEPRDPSSTVLYNVIAEHLETFLAPVDDDRDAKGLHDYVQREFYDYLQCGILAHGFLRLGCDTCQKEVLLAFSCKRRGFCASCAGRRRMALAACPPGALRRVFGAHSKLRAAIIPTPRQQGVDGDESKTGTPYWNWARLLGRVFDLDMATCPFCRRGGVFRPFMT